MSILHSLPCQASLSFFCGSLSFHQLVIDIRAVYRRRTFETNIRSCIFWSNRDQLALLLLFLLQELFSATNGVLRGVPGHGCLFATTGTATITTTCSSSTSHRCITSGGRNRTPCPDLGSPGTTLDIFALGRTCSTKGNTCTSNTSTATSFV